MGAMLGVASLRRMEVSPAGRQCGERGGVAGGRQCGEKRRCRQVASVGRQGRVCVGVVMQRS
eukprot:280376-Chlamydomonas_euryale.AAC.1